MFDPVIVIPVFQHGEALNDTVLRLCAWGIPLIVVDDGSDPAQNRLIRKACRGDHVMLLTRNSNGGKGAAVIDGLKEAKRRGCTHVFQIDADGQHDFSCLPKFIRAAQQHPAALILGYACYDNSIPASRRCGRWITHIWVWINTLSFRVRDSMCGFRIYPLASTLEIIAASTVGKHMEFDAELCVRFCWKNLPVINLPVGVTYPKDGKSNFRMKQDNILISLMHARLFFGMLLRFPVLLLARIQTIMFGKLKNIK